MARTPDPVEAERTLTRELLRGYRLLNANLFDGALKSPGLMLVDSRGFLARWLPGTRQIEVSRDLVHQQPWTVVLEVLKHEMAHQYVHEVLCADETPHGPAFRQVCTRLGIDPRSAGLPGEITLEAGAQRALERVQKLLALAQSDNQHEAESAAAAAQRLMLKHNLAEQDAQAAPAYTFRQLGRITGRTQEWERRLGNLLSEHFFVEVIWVPAYRPRDGRRGHVMEAIGSEPNLELAEYVHGFVSRAAQELWTAHKRRHQIRGDAQRRSFLSGVIAGFDEKLQTQRAEHAAEGLVWQPEAARERYVRKRHPRIRRVSHRTPLSREAFGEGRAQGRGLVLHRGVGPGAQSRSSGPRLLRG